MATSKKRDDEPKKVVTVGEDFSFLVPFQDDAESTIAGMAEHRVLNRLKVVQSLSKPGTKEVGGEGAVLIMPATTLVARMGDSFNFVPFFFFEEFICWSDIRDQQSPKIQQRSLDRKSKCAEMARDPKQWAETYEGGTKDKPFIRRYCEHLNFAGTIYQAGHELDRVPCVLSFARGEFKIGRQFISNITMRRINGRQAPLWATVWECSSASHKNQTGQEWYGIDVKNAERPYIDPSDVEIFKAEHELLKKAHADEALSVNMNDAEEEVAAADPAASTSY